MASVWLTSNPSVVNSAEVEVQCLPSGVTASIAGGSREVSYQDPWVLDASGAQDLDEVATDPMRYSWTCVSVGVDGLSPEAPCVQASGSGAGQVLVLPPADSNQARVSFGPGILLAGQYRFRVDVRKGQEGELVPLHFRSASAVATITVVSGRPPVVLMDRPSVKVNRGQTVQLTASVNDNGTPGVTMVRVAAAWGSCHLRHGGALWPVMPLCERLFVMLFVSSAAVVVSGPRPGSPIVGDPVSGSHTTHAGYPPGPAQWLVRVPTGCHRPQLADGDRQGHRRDERSPSQRVCDGGAQQWHRPDHLVHVDHGWLAG